MWPRWRTLDGGWHLFKNVDVVVNLGLVLLGNALADPNNVAALLLLQLHKCVEDSVVELLHKREAVQLHLVLKKLVLKRTASDIFADALEHLLVVRVVIGHTLDLLELAAIREHGQPFRVQLADARVQLLSIVLCQLGAKRVNGNVERAAVGLKLSSSKAGAQLVRLGEKTGGGGPYKGRARPVCTAASKRWLQLPEWCYLKNLAHDIGRGTAQLLAKLVKILQVLFVQSAPDDLNVELVQIRFRDAVDEVRRYESESRG